MTIWLNHTVIQQCPISLYRPRWGIEAMFRDCKRSAYNLEKTQVNELRLLAVVLIIAIAYSLATFCGEYYHNLKESEYISHPKERRRSIARQSVFTMGLQVLALAAIPGNVVGFGGASADSQGS